MCPPWETLIQSKKENIEKIFHFFWLQERSQRSPLLTTTTTGATLIEIYRWRRKNIDWEISGQRTKWNESQLKIET